MLLTISVHLYIGFVVDSVEELDLTSYFFKVFCNFLCIVVFAQNV